MMRHIRSFGFVVVAVALLALTLPASAEDLLKLAIAQRGAWNSAVPELGQLAGIFKKHGIVLELAYTEGEDDTEQQVSSGSADVGEGVSIMGVLHAYATNGAPVRASAQICPGLPITGMSQQHPRSRR